MWQIDIDEGKCNGYNECVEGWLVSISLPLVRELTLSIDGAYGIIWIL